MNRISLALVWACLGVSLGAWGQDKATPGPPNATEIAAWIARFSHEEPQTREEAQKKLLQIGASAIPPLQEATKSGDPEVRVRAKTVLVEFEKAALQEKKDLLKVFSGGPKAPQEMVLRTEKEWTEMVASCISDELRNSLAKWKIDFSKQMLVAVALGPFNSLLAKSEIEKVGIGKVVPENERWIVHFSVGHSDKRGAPEYPLWLTLIPKTEKPVEFKKETFDWGG